MKEQGREASLGWGRSNKRCHRGLLPLVQICAVLAAVTEVIRSQGGKETETEYFAALVSGYDLGWVLRAAGYSSCREKRGAPGMWGEKDNLEQAKVLQSFSRDLVSLVVFAVLFV